MQVMTMRPGVTLCEVFYSVNAAVGRADRALFRDLLRQAEGFDLAAAENHHGLTRWLFAIQDGLSPLPWPVPRALLLAYLRGHKARVRAGGGTVLHCWRCDGCGLLLPNYNELGEGARFGSCPVCGSAGMTAVDLPEPRDRPFGDGRRQVDLLE